MSTLVIVINAWAVMFFCVLVIKVDKLIAMLREIRDTLKDGGK